MIITVTLNAAIDKSLSVPNFRLGRRHRTVERRALAGGKGVNIARTLKTLGQPVIATGFAGGPTGTQIVAQLAEESILHDFVRIREESRTNTSVLDPTTGEQTEINEQGPSIERRRGRAVPREAALPRARRGDRRARRLAAARRRARPLRAARARAAQARRDDGRRHRRRAAAPGGARRARRRLARTCVEAEELVGHEFNDDEDRADAVREIVSLGARSAIMTTRDGCWAQVLVDGAPRALPRRRSRSVESVATVGSGDAFLAGYVAARYRGCAPAECLRFGVACGAESTGRLGAGLIDLRAVERLLADVAAQRGRAARRRALSRYARTYAVAAAQLAFVRRPSVRLET